jgi:hypothetical protein
MVAATPRLDLEAGRYDQSEYSGRAKHFFATVNPLNVLASDEQLDAAKKLVVDYRAGTEDPSVSDGEVWDAKELYDSAFHCQTGEKLFLPGRMSFQVPGNMVRLFNRFKSFLWFPSAHHRQPARCLTYIFRHSQPH